MVPSMNVQVCHDIELHEDLSQVPVSHLVHQACKYVQLVTLDSIPERKKIHKVIVLLFCNVMPKICKKINNQNHSGCLKNYPIKKLL